MKKVGVTLPALGEYAVGMLFLPRDPDQRAKCKADLERVANSLGHSVLGWRTVRTRSRRGGLKEFLFYYIAARGHPL